MRLPLLKKETLVEKGYQGDSHPCPRGGAPQMVKIYFRVSQYLGNLGKRS